MKVNAPSRGKPKNQQCDFEPRNSPANGEVERAFDHAAKD
jgi:hypothetical protein